MRPPDILGLVQLMKTEDGGRHLVMEAPRFGCVAKISDDYWSCLILLEKGQRLAAGASAVVPISFLARLVRGLPRLQEGDVFELWEGKPVGRCLVKTVFPTFGL